MICPSGHIAEESTTVPGFEGTPIYRCKPCRKLSVAEALPGQWVAAGVGWQDRLRAAAGIVRRELDAHEQMWESDIRDPRWTQLGWTD